MSENKRRKAPPKPKSRLWVIIVVPVIMLVLAGGLLAAKLMPEGIDLTALMSQLPQMPASSTDIVNQAVATYAQTNDLAQARSALAGLDDVEVAKQLTAMEVNATDTVTRQQVGKLRRALGLSVVVPSAVDLVLSEQTIWLTSAVAALPFLAALILSLGSSVQAMLKNRMTETRQARGRSAAHAAAEANQISEDEPIQDLTPEQTAEAQAAQAAALTAVAAKAKKEKPAEDKPIGVTADPMSGGEVSATIQGILSDVFGDETQQTRRTVLLQGLRELSANQLLASCRQVADRLRMNRASVTRRPGSTQDPVQAGN